MGLKLTRLKMVLQLVLWIQKEVDKGPTNRIRIKCFSFNQSKIWQNNFHSHLSRLNHKHASESRVNGYKWRD